MDLNESFEGRSRRWKTEKATTTVINLLEENMKHLEDMEEEKIRMQQEHEEERHRLEEQMEQIVDQWLEQKARLEEEMEDEKLQLRRAMDDFREECEDQMALEKEQMSKQAEELRCELERIAAEKASMEKQMQRCRQEAEDEGRRMAEEKAEMQRKMEEFRAECSQKIAEERQQLSRKKAEHEAECERGMAEKEAEMGRKVDAMRTEFEAKIAEEKRELARKTDEFRAEEARLAQEKDQMMQQVENFTQDCERKMAEEKAEMAEKKQEFQLECRRLEEEKAEMVRKMGDFRKECELKMEQEKRDMSGEMANYRTSCEQKIRQSEASMVQRTEEWQRERERLEQETQRVRGAMELEMAETERKFAEERLAMSSKTAAFVAECERKMEEKEMEMARQTDQLSRECEALAQEKAETMREMALFRAEVERLEEDNQGITQQMVHVKTESVNKMKEKEMEMERKTREFTAECERLEKEKGGMIEKMASFRAECEQKMAEQKAQLMREATDFRTEVERLAKEKADMTESMASFQLECSRKMEEKEGEMARKTHEFRAECDRLERDKAEMKRRMEAFTKECESKMAEEKAEVAKQTAEFFAECQRKMEENEREMNKKSLEFQTERSRLAQEKATMTRQMGEFRAECERKISEEEERMLRMTSEFRQESERKVAEEKAASARRLADTRRQTEEQLRKERQITDHIMNVLRELPPLQTAMELGDLALLEQELTKWKLEALPERFGEGKGVVEAVVKLAKERVVTWRGVEHTWKDVLRQVERLPGSVGALTQQCQRLFRALKEAQLTKMDLRRSDAQAIERICEVFFVWQERAMCCSNGVQKAIVRKVVSWPQLGVFDFADLDICLRLVDRGGLGSDVFLSRALALVEDPNTAPKEFRSLLSHVETMLFFLKYAASEDLAMAHTEFRRQGGEIDATVSGYIAWAARAYPPGGEIVRLSEGNALVESNVAMRVLEEIRRPARGRQDGLGPFREIFYQWALAMRSRFDLLVLPHHTQVICLLIFQRFLEAERTPSTPLALIAQVGTGEGKSMIVAALAIYVVIVLGKKAHVVVDDETLLERDFWNFKRLFDAFQVPGKAGAPRRPLTSAICTSEERMVTEGGDRSSKRVRVDPDVDICYCEAKHVQSFYASIARGEKRDFGEYENRVLILDEVDALVIDEEPNEAFVYPNQELSEMATVVAEALSHGIHTGDVPVLQNSEHPATTRVVKEMSKEWQRGKQFVEGEDFVYSKELGRYCALQSGRANPKAWSLALECRNFQDGFSHEILFQERLFVMSRPRVFRKYHRILGLSGSIGSKPERAYLKDTYRAAFFEVPPFLKTCRGSPFHEPVPVRTGEQKKAVYVETSVEAQISRLAEIALQARERVPVLVISRDRLHADQLVEGLRSAARSRGLGGASEDVVRSLSRTLYEADAEQWKENLNRSTLPIGENSGASKSWRVTITDPRGGRGTDYRVDDSSVDEQGGLLLITTLVPTSQREWIQFLGRTARQDRRGQYCAVLNSTDYEALSKRYREQLPTGGGLEAIQAVLGWGDRQVMDKIQASAALYNCGVRMNELCEDLFGRCHALLKDPSTRERLVDVCQRHRWMSVREVNEAFARMPGFDPSSLPSEARDLGRPSEPPVVSRLSNASAGPGLDAGLQSGAVGAAKGELPAAPKVVVFCLDWSCSMMSRDTRTPLTRFETCLKCVQRILQDQVRSADHVGVVCFGPRVEVVVPITQKSTGGRALASKIQTLRPQTSGGTAFFDAVAQCLQMLNQPNVAPAEALKWLVCLTDGDDLGSRRENARGEIVNQMLHAGIPSNLNMVMITVGSLRAGNVKVIDSWVEKVSSTGGLGRHVSEKDAAAIAKAFDVVAECLATEVGGATEC